MVCFGQETEYQFKFIMAGNFYVLPADRDYAAARAMILFGMRDQFYWQVVHSMEKLFKATLVVNDVSAKNYQHDIVALYTKFCEVYGDHSHIDLIKPENLDDKYWTDISVDRFIRRMHRNGDEHSRYGLTSNIAIRGELFIYDQLYMKLRSRTIGLSWTIGNEIEAPKDMDHLKGHPVTCLFDSKDSRSFRPIMAISTHEPVPLSDMRQAILSLNFEVLPDEPSDGIPQGFAQQLGPLKNSWLFQIINHYSDIVPNKRQRKNLQWIIDHIPMPPYALKELNAIKSKSA